MARQIPCAEGPLWLLVLATGRLQIHPSHGSAAGLLLVLATGLLTELLATGSATLQGTRSATEQTEPR